jgi:CheY-like chemotaxis protein
MRILVVEDDAQVRVLSEALLEDAGHETLSAANVEEARALVEADEHIDLLFTDLGLGNDQQAGLALAAEVRRRRPNIPVLYTTGQDVTDGMRALFVDPSGLLPKPYTPDQLQAAIQSLGARASQ